MKLGTIFGLEQYDEAYQYILEKGYEIQEMDSTNGVRQFKIVLSTQPTEEELKQTRITELKQLLSQTDYVVIKIAEGEATKEEYAEILAQRKEWRAEINSLQ